MVISKMCMLLSENFGTRRLYEEYGLEGLEFLYNFVEKIEFILKEKNEYVVNFLVKIVYTHTPTKTIPFQQQAFHWKHLLVYY